MKEERKLWFEEEMKIATDFTLEDFRGWLNYGCGGGKSCYPAVTPKETNSLNNQ